jgi:hypothetical protein
VTLADILKRLREATGADREIDAALYNALHKDDFRPVAFNALAQDDPEYFDLSRYHDGWLVGKTKRDIYAEDLEHYTASLDAAIALVERTLPGAEWYVWNNAHDQNNVKRGPGATLWHDSLAELHDGTWSGGDAHLAATPALALLIALLEALSDKGEPKP